MEPTLLSWQLAPSCSLFCIHQAPDCQAQTHYSDTFSPPVAGCTCSVAPSNMQAASGSTASLLGQPRCAVEGLHDLKSASVDLTWIFAESAEQAEQHAQAAADPGKVFREGAGMAQPSPQNKDKGPVATSQPKAPSEVEDSTQPASKDDGNSAECDIDVPVSWLPAVVCHCALASRASAIELKSFLVCKGEILQLPAASLLWH